MCWVDSATNLVKWSPEAVTFARGAAERGPTGGHKSGTILGATLHNRLDGVVGARRHEMVA
jgi:hypothetical protein